MSLIELNAHEDEQLVGNKSITRGKNESKKGGKKKKNEMIY